MSYDNINNEIETAFRTAKSLGLTELVTIKRTISSFDVETSLVDLTSVETDLHAVIERISTITAEKGHDINMVLNLYSEFPINYGDFVVIDNIQYEIIKITNTFYMWIVEVVKA